MVRSPRCAHDRAQPGSAAGNPGRGAARARPTAGLAKKERKKKREKGHWGRGRGRGGGREPQVPPQKIPRNGEGSLLSSSRPPPPKIIWKLLPTSSGTSDTFLHFQADKALSRESPGPLSGQREGFPRGPLPLPPSRPTRNHRSDGCHPRPTGRLGLRARGRGGHQHF